MACLILEKKRNLRSLPKSSGNKKLTIGMWCAHQKFRFSNFKPNSRNRSSLLCIVSNTIFLCIDTKQRAKRSRRCQDIHRNQCAPLAEGETKIQNQPLRPARRSDFGLCRGSRVSAWSRNTNPREERVRISRDFRDSRGHTRSLLLKHEMDF